MVGAHDVAEMPSFAENLIPFEHLSEFGRKVDQGGSLCFM